MKLTGVGNTMRHQEVLADLLYAFIDKTKKTKTYNKFKALPEIGVDSKVPDIVVYKISRNKMQAVAILEICNKNSFENDLSKCEQLMHDNSTIEEAFVIDISGSKPQIKNLYRLKTGKISKPRSITQFKALNIDLMKLV